jgi:hypothetical protein
MRFTAILEPATTCFFAVVIDAQPLKPLEQSNALTLW